MKFRYKIELLSGEVINGERELTAGVNRIVEALPKGTLKSISGTLPLVIGADEKIFMNGYQTWTFCPELNKSSSIRAMGKLPKVLINHYGIDRYGDYHFVNYPNRRGVTHGESYCYFRRGGRFRLFASLDEMPGYTMFMYDSSRSILTVSRDCEGVSCGGEYHVFDLFLAEGEENEVFDAWFAAMNIKPRTNERIAGYSSWYNRYQKISEQSIMDDLNGCAAVMREGDLFQIDDGWEPYVGDWLEPDGKKFPRGMKAAADEIHSRGFKAGLWLAPFVAQKGSALMRQHPDWLLYVDSEPWRDGSNWGGFYSLDIDNPEVAEYLRKCFDRVLNDWGYDLVKLDFLYAAAPFGRNGESRAARMTRAVKLLREMCGDKLILGCGVPLMPAFGEFDYCRISCDVGLDWDNTPIMRLINRERVSTRHAILNSDFRRQLSGRAWLSDPDVFFLRDDNLKLSEREKYILSAVNSLFGGVLLCSDNMGEYDGEKREYYRRLLKMRDAKNIIVHADDGLSVSFELDGVNELIEIE